MFAYYPNSITAILAFILKVIPYLNCNHVNYYGGDYQQILASGNYSALSLVKFRFIYSISRFKSKLNICAGPVLSSKLQKLSPAPSIITKPFLSIKKSTNISLKPPLKDTLNICYVGVFSRRKGCHLFHEIFSHITVKRVNLHLIGKGPLEEFLHRSLSSIPNLTTIYHGFLSSPDDIQDIVSSADFLLLPSFAEGFPRVIYEALNVGTMVVARDVGSVSSILSEFNLDDYYLPVTAAPNDFSKQIQILFSKASSSSFLKEQSFRHQRLIDSVFDSDPASQHSTLFVHYESSFSL